MTILKQPKVLEVKFSNLLGRARRLLAVGRTCKFDSSEEIVFFRCAARRSELLQRLCWNFSFQVTVNKQYFTLVYCIIKTQYFVMKLVCLRSQKTELFVRKV